jgi:DNA polymerase-1
MEDTIAIATEHGYVSTPCSAAAGYLPELASSNKNIQAFGKRVAMNPPRYRAVPQILSKSRWCGLFDRLEREGMQARLILQVHDELIVEAPKAELAHAREILKEEMEHAAELAVPMLVDVESGATWYDAK